MKEGRGRGWRDPKQRGKRKKREANVLYHHYIRSRDSETKKKSQFLGHSESVVIVRSDTHHIEGVRKKDFAAVCTLESGEKNNTFRLCLLHLPSFSLCK